MHMNMNIKRIISIALLTLSLCACLQAAEAPQADYRTTRHGFIRDWLKLGPIVYGKQPGDPMQTHPINYEKLIKAELVDPTWEDYLGGDWKIAPSAGDVTQIKGIEAKQLIWQPLHSPADRINLDRKADYELNYLVAYLWSPRDIAGAAIYTGSDDFIEIFVNGQCVHVYKAERRGIGQHDEVRNVHLRQGWNVINAKVVDVSHGYEFFLAVADETGTLMRDLPISLTRPEGLVLCDEPTMLASKSAMHEKGQEKVPPEKAFFDPAVAVGAHQPVKIDFAHDAKLAIENKQQPLGMAVAGVDKPIPVRYSVSAYDPANTAQRKYPLPKGVDAADLSSAPPGKVKIVAELLRRDARQDWTNTPKKDKVLDREEAEADLAQGSFAGKPFTVPTGEAGYFAVEVSVYKNEKLIRYDDCSFAVVTPMNQPPQKFTEALPESAKDWQDGDWKRWRSVVDNQSEPRQLKFWPALQYSGGELTTPVPANLLEGSIGLGHITPTLSAAPATITYVRQDWLEDTRIYTFRVDGKMRRMDYVSCKALPGMQVRTDHNQITLFEGIDSVGLGRPAYLAYNTAQGVRIVPADQLSSAQGIVPDMSAPWMLFWFNGSENWKAADMPVLVVLQHKPTALRQTADGITLSFAKEAGAVAAMPLLGSRIVRPADTVGWSTALPAKIVEECAFWSRALRNYPRTGKDRFRLVGDDIEVRVDFDYVATVDDWNTQPLKFAPLPPWTALASEHPTSVIQLPSSTHKTRLLTTDGPVYGTVGDGAALYTLKGVAHYVTEVREVSDVRRDGVLARAYEDLEFVNGDGRMDALGYMNNLGGEGNWEGNFTYHRVLLRHDPGYKFGQHCFENENSMIANVSHSLAYLPEDQAVKLKALMMRFMDIGMMLERWDGFNDSRLMYEDVQWFISRFMAGTWSYGHYTGHWQMLKDRFPLIKVEFASLAKEMHWSHMRSAGSEESNLLYQGAIGYARTAKVAGDIPEHLYGMYYATRHLALQQALWMTIKNDGYQRESYFGSNRLRVAMDDAQAEPKRPALFFWWLMENPIYDPQDTNAAWHATVISPFSYPYYPEIMRFQTEKNEPFIQYYLTMWQIHWPKWYEGKTGGWGVYFGAPEYFASRGWMVDYTHETPEQMMEKYLQNHWGQKGPKAGGYEFNNRGWMSLPKALIAIIEASGQRRWVKSY